MNRTNVIVVVIVALAVVVGVLGYQVYLDRTKPGVQINVGPNGVSIQGK